MTVQKEAISLVVVAPRLGFDSKQNQIQYRDSDLVLSKTKSETETQI